MTRVIVITLLAILALFTLAPWVITEVLPGLLPADW